MDPPSQHAFKFRATNAWNSLLYHFQRSTSSTSVFSGSQAVNVLYEFVSKNPALFNNALVTREKIVKLAETLFNQNAIVPINETIRSFYDSNEIGYRFAPENSTPKFSNPCTSMPNLNYSGSAASTENHTPLKRSFAAGSPFFGSMRKKNGFHPIDKHKFSPSKSETEENASLFSEDGEEIDMDESLLKEIVLFRLLTLVDCPILDGILHYQQQQEAKSSSLWNLVSFFRRRNWTSTALAHRTQLAGSLENLNSDDPLIRAALECLPVETCAEVLNTISFQFSPLDRHRYLFVKVQAANKSMAAVNGPLIAEEYADLIVQIYEKFAQKHNELALEAVQLLVLLFPKETRSHLSRLLKFLFLVAIDDAPEMKLLHDLRNCDAALSEFPDVILPKMTTNIMNASQRRYFLAFMIENSAKIGEIPDSLRHELAERMDRKRYTVAEPKPVVGFVEWMSEADYKQQGETCTESSLIKLVNSVVDDPKLRLEEKKRFLENFKSLYGEIFTKNFSGILNW